MYKLIVFCLLASCASLQQTNPKPLFGYIEKKDKIEFLFSEHPRYLEFKEAAKSDLSKWLPKYEQQGKLSSCTAFCVANVVEGIYKKKYGHFFGSSKLFLYYNGRIDKKRDDGSPISHTIASAIREGITTTKYWPYIEQNRFITPPEVAYVMALNYRVSRAYKVDNKDVARALSNGYPVIIGVEVYKQFDNLNKDSYIVTLPNKKEKSTGYHAMIIVGHNNKTQLYLVNNSWGKEWGLGGTCYVPFGYVMNKKITKECWTIDYVE